MVPKLIPKKSTNDKLDLEYICYVVFLLSDKHFVGRQMLKLFHKVTKCSSHKIMVAVWCNFRAEFGVKSIRHLYFHSFGFLYVVYAKSVAGTQLLKLKYMLTKVINEYIYGFITKLKILNILKWKYDCIYVCTANFELGFIYKRCWVYQLDNSYYVDKLSTVPCNSLVHKAIFLL